MIQCSIIGGGIIGMSAAYHLSLRSEVGSITVYEKDPSYFDASFARSCGGFRSQYYTSTNVLMSRYSIDFFKKNLDLSHLFLNGYLMLFDHGMTNNHDSSLAMQQKLGATTQSLGPRELQSRFPWLNVSNLYAGCLTDDSSEGWLDSHELHAWYKENASASGKMNLKKGDGRDFDHSGQKICITSGCWSGNVGSAFGLNLPVVPHKHTVFIVKTETPVISEMPLIADLPSGVYLRPESDGYIVGYDGNGTFGDSDLEPNYETWDEIWMHLYTRFPSIFDACKMTGAWSGYYDASTIDNNAIIDSQNDITFATGFTGRGLMHSPAVGLTLSEMIIDGEPITFPTIAQDFALNRNSENVEKYVI